MELTLVTYNIHSGIGTDGRFDLGRIAGVIAETGADLAALQEVGDWKERTDREDHPEQLAARLGSRVAFGPNIVRNGRRYGNAVLSRLPILRSRNYDLSVRFHEPRGALRCDLDLGGGKPLHLFAVHLGLSRRERRQQEGLLLSSDILRDAVRPDPVVVCGDFNYWWIDGGVSWLVRHAIRDVGRALDSRGRTYPSAWPVFRLDRIFVDHGVRPLGLRVHRTPLSQVASDHLPVVMRFEAPIPDPLPAHPVQIIS